MSKSSPVPTTPLPPELAFNMLYIYIVSKFEMALKSIKQVLKYTENSYSHPSQYVAVFVHFLCIFSVSFYANAKKYKYIYSYFPLSLKKDNVIYSVLHILFLLTISNSSSSFFLTVVAHVYLSSSLLTDPWPLSSLLPLQTMLQCIASFKVMSDVCISTCGIDSQGQDCSVQG